MNKKLFFSLLIMTTMLISGTKALCETTADDVTLPAPTITGGMPIMDAFKNRKTSVRFSKEPIPLQTLSDLLWAADGVNRPDGKRTAPSAMNSQMISIYVAMPSGIYIYEPQEHSLKAFSKEDVRPIVGKFPLILLYVADLSKQSKYNAVVDCGFVGQNVYLYSAANDLNTIFLYGVNAYALNSKLDFKLGQEVLFAQAVGLAPSK